jgi:hypothetical protein
MQTYLKVAFVYLLLTIVHTANHITLHTKDLDQVTIYQKESSPFPIIELDFQPWHFERIDLDLPSPDDYDTHNYYTKVKIFYGRYGEDLLASFELNESKMSTLLSFIYELYEIEETGSSLIFNKKGESKGSKVAEFINAYIHKEASMFVTLKMLFSCQDLLASKRPMWSYLDYTGASVDVQTITEALDNKCKSVDDIVKQKLWDQSYLLAKLNVAVFDEYDFEKSTERINELYYEAFVQLGLK